MIGREYPTVVRFSVAGGAEVLLALTGPGEAAAMAMVPAGGDVESAAAELWRAVEAVEPTAARPALTLSTTESPARPRGRPRTPPRLTILAGEGLR